MHTLIHPKLPLAFMMPLLLWACGGGADLAGPEGVDDQLTQPQFKATTLTEQTTIEFVSSPLFNPCTEEDVIFDIRIHVVDHVTEDATGGLHINGSANFQGSKGVGQTSGLTYRLVGRSGQGFNGPVNDTNGASVDHFVLKQRWVAQGNADDRALVTVWTFIVDANGEVIVDTFESEDECDG